MARFIPKTNAKQQLPVDDLVFMLWENGLMLRVLFGGVPMLGSLGTFGMLMHNGCHSLPKIIVLYLS